MENQTTKKFTDKINTSELLKERGWWSAFRRSLSPCMHNESDQQSIESRINAHIGNIEEYDKERILKLDNPQGEIDRLVRNVENAFRLLNNYYIALNRSKLGLKFIITWWKMKNSVWNNVEIKEFVLGKSPDQDRRNSEFNFFPTNYRWETFEFGSNTFSNVVNVTVDIDGFDKDSLEAIKVVFGDAMHQIVGLRQLLHSAQNQLNYESNIRRIAQNNSASLRESLDSVWKEGSDHIHL